MALDDVVRRAASQRQARSKESGVRVVVGVEDADELAGATWLSAALTFCALEVLSWTFSSDHARVAAGHAGQLVLDRERVAGVL